MLYEVITGLVVAGFANGKLVALSADKGFVGWETNIAIPQGRSELERIVDIDGDPVIVGTAVYVTTYQGSIAVIDLQSGNVITSYSIHYTKLYELSSPTRSPRT